jgi:hypothetical protein
MVMRGIQERERERDKGRETREEVVEEDESCMQMSSEINCRYSKTG